MGRGCTPKRRDWPRRRDCCASAAGSGTSPPGRSDGRPSCTGSSGSSEDFGADYEAYFERVHPDDRERVAGLIAHAVQTAMPLEFEHRIVRPDDSVRTLHCRGEVVSSEGSPVRVFGICQDITERKRIQDEVAIERELAFSVDGSECVEEALQTVLSAPMPVRGLRAGSGLDDRNGRLRRVRSFLAVHRLAPGRLHDPQQGDDVRGRQRSARAGLGRQRKRSGSRT